MSTTSRLLIWLLLLGAGAPRVCRAHATASAAHSRRQADATVVAASPSGATSKVRPVRLDGGQALAEIALATVARALGPRAPVARPEPMREPAERGPHRSRAPPATPLR